MTDEWDFYPLRVDGDPASIFLDMGVARSAPIPGFNKSGYLRIWMNQPRTDGLSSQEEYDTLVTIEDALTAAVGRSSATVYVGRNTSGGRRDFFFYTRDEEEFRAAVLNAMSMFAGYRTEIGTRPDEGWSTYFEFLYPHADQKQGMANRAVIAALSQNGDDGTTPREIDHLIILGDRGRADSVARIISEQGFRLKPGTPSKQPDAHWWVEFDRTEVPVEIDETTIALAKLAQEHGGEYDGWGSEAVTA